MSKVGFKPTWMQEQEQTEMEVHAPIQNIVNEEPLLTPAHTELVARIQANEAFMTSTKFSKLNKEEKAQILGNYKWLVAINAQLGGQ